MKPIVATLLLSGSLLCVPPARADEPPPLLVFVGEQLDFAELPDPCEDPDNLVALHGGDAGDQQVCVVMDVSFWARYRVRETVLGVAPTDVIEFLVADHHGLPAFARARTALLFVTLEAEGAALVKYQGYPVFATADGDWAYCGDPYPPDTPATDRRVVPIDFADGVAFGDTSSLGPLAIADYDPAIYERHGERMFCRRGVRLLDLYEFVARDRFGSTEFDLGVVDDRGRDETIVEDD